MMESEFILQAPPCKSAKINKTIGEVFFEQAEKYPEAVFQIDAVTGKQETFRDVKRRSTRVALYLRSIGVKPKDIVLLCCKNNIDNIVPALASLYIGAWVSSVDPKQTVHDVKHAVNLTKPKAIVVERDSLSLVEKSLQDFSPKPFVVVIGDSSSAYPNMLEIENNSEGENEFSPIKQDPTDVAVIIFSSGTTSLPKGIQLSHWAMLNVVPPILQQNYLKAGVILHFASLYWVSAWIMTCVCIATATAKIIGPSINGLDFLRIVEQHKVTHVFSSSTFTYQVTDVDKATALQYDTSSLFSLSIGGSTMDPEQIQRLREYLPHTHINLSYGSSEANYLLGHDCTKVKSALEKISSSGTLFPNTQMKFVDLENERLLGPNEEGEIRIKSKFIMSGYLNYSNPNAFDKDGFLKTGDLGYYDEDHYVYVTDRISEMFKYKANQISPTILENVMHQHPAVREAVAFGVPHTIDRNHPAACVVLKNGAKVSCEELADFVNSKVSDMYRLRGGVMIMDSIPKTPTGKLQRRMVRDTFIAIIKKRIK